MKQHAPTLKVYVFEGWTKLRQNVALTRADQARIAAKAKAKTKTPAKGRKPKKAVTAAKKGKVVPSDVIDLSDEDVKAAKPAVTLPARGHGRKGTSSAAKRYVDADSDEEEDEEPIVNKEEDEDEGPLDEWAWFCQDYDVVITTYATLGKELGVAKGGVDRPRRRNVEYQDIDKPRSPLVSVEWSRVIMDEVQQAGGHRTVEMVSLIPRKNSFAVSGTPARGEVDDLRHVLT